MNDDSEAVRPFRLIIKFDLDGVEWTRLLGEMDHVMMLDRLPKPLSRRFQPILHKLHATQAKSLSLESDLHRLLEEKELEVVTLLAWWIEWHRRSSLSRSVRFGQKTVWRAWNCPDCECEVTHERGHCDDSRCDSWNKLHAITDEVILAPIEQTA